MNSRLIAVAGAAVLALSLSACSTSTTTDGPSASEEATNNAPAGATTNAASPEAAHNAPTEATESPTTPPTASYSAPEDNQVAPHLIVTHIPEGHSLTTDDIGSDRLLFATAASAEELSNTGSVSGYLVRLGDATATVEGVIEKDAESINVDPDDFAATGEAAVDGETAQTFSGEGSLSDDSGYVAERGAVVTHNGQTFVITAKAFDKSDRPTLSEDEFNAFLKGIVWTD